MKQKPTILMLLLAANLGLQAQNVLFTEDFETDGQGLRYTASQPFNDGTSDHWNRTDGSDIANVTGSYINVSGSFFWAAEDTDDDGGNGADEQTLEITGVDITGQSNLQFQGLFGAGNENGAGASAYDSLDYIKVQAQIDGAGYVDVLWFSFLDAGDTFNEPLGVDRDFDGIADSASDLLGTALNSYSASIAGSGSTLDLRILVYMDSGNEEIAFDNLQITAGVGVSTPSLMLTESTGGTAVEEGGASDSFTIALGSEPTAPVDVILTPDAELDLGNGAGASLTLTFSTVNYATPQTVTVNAFDDADDEGSHTGSITISTTTIDIDYAAISDSITVGIADNDAPPSALPVAWINEFHYDEDGADTNEFVEVFVGSSYAGPLASLTLTLYNGGTDNSYNSLTVDSFTPGTTIDGVGTFYSIDLPSNLQNGAPDGLALSDGDGLIEFISYEGSFTAADGPASGITSTDVGVEETGSAAIDSSIYRTGTGSVAADFTWAVADGAATKGALNNGQTLGGGGPADLTPPTLTATTPADDATGVSLLPLITLTMDESIRAGSGNITLHLASDDSVVESFDVASDVTFNGASASFIPSNDSLSLSTAYYVKVVAGAIEDLAGNAFAGITDATSFNFTTGTEILAISEAIGTVSIESSGPNETDQFYAQADLDGNFDEYSMAEFLLDPFDFGGLTVTDISSVELDLTVNDRSFSTSGDFYLLFTTDSKADLGDYSALVYDSSSTYGIATAEYQHFPVEIGAGPYNYPYDGASNGGTILTFNLDLSGIKNDLINAINSGEAFHLLIGVPTDGTGAVPTFSGVGNTFDPGTPTLRISATPGAAPAALILTESNGSTDVAEGGANDSFEVALNTLPADSVDLILTPDAELDLGSGAGNPVTLTFTTANATTPQTVTVMAVDDADVEGNHTGAISISTVTTDPHYSAINDSVSVNIADNDLVISAGSVIITQLYEGASNDKYIEITNVGLSPVDLTGWQIVRWGNANAEAYKNTAGTIADLTSAGDFDAADLSPLGTIAVGQTFVIANSDASAPPLDGADVDLAFGFPGPITFNGNDSVVLYNSASISPAMIEDAIGFLETDNLDNRSYVRLSTGIGWDDVPGSNLTSFPAIWSEVSTADVDDAQSGTTPDVDNFLGTTALVPAPTSVSFQSSSLTVNETDGTAAILVKLSTSSATTSEITVDVAFLANAGGPNDASLADIGNYVTQTATFPIGSLNGATETITVTITDDSEGESQELAQFELGNVTGDAIIANPSTFDLTLLDDENALPAVVINEIIQNPAAVGDSSGEWFELYNSGATPVDINGWTISDNGSDSHVIDHGGPLVIPALGYLVLGREADSSLNGGVNLDYIYSGFNLANGDDEVILTDGSGNEIDRVEYDGGPNWPDPTGASMALLDPTLDNNDGNNWAESTASFGAGDLGTPGAENFAPDSTPPAISTLAPLDDASDVDVNTNLVITFDENVSEGTGNITLYLASDDSVVETFNVSTDVSISGASVTINPTSNLAAGTSYYVQIDAGAITDTAAAPNAFAGILDTTTWNFTTATPIAGLINEEDFTATGGPDDWFNETVSGDDAWDLSLNDGFIDGGLSETEIDEHYLISPELDLSGSTGVSISFLYGGSYDGDINVENLTLVYSTNYSGDASTATWVEVPFDFSNITTDQADVVNPDDLVASGAVSLAAVDNTAGVRIAFRYLSPDATIDSSEQWVIDNIVITEAAGSDPLGDYLTARGLTTGDLETDTNGNGFTVLEEYLAGFGDGAGNDRILFGVKATTNALTLTSDSSAIPDGITAVLMVTNDLTIAPVPSGYTTNVVGPDSNGDYTIEFVETFVPGSSPALSGQRFFFLEITAN